MRRTFVQHIARQTRSLDGVWDFVTDPGNAGISEEWFINFPSDSRKLVVPSCWNNELGLFEYIGAAWYRTFFDITEESNIRLIFEGILHHADVYVDGKHLAYHFGGYTQFSALIPHLAPGRHELIVRVDSTLDWQTLPTDVADWYSYGGIMRSVELQELPDVYIDSLKIDYQLQGSDADISLQLQLNSLSGEDRELTITASTEGLDFPASTAHVPAGQSVKLTLRGSLANVRKWDVGRPELYTFSVQAGEDDLIDRTGFRTVEVRGGQILLNGKELYLQGVNRHEEHPEWGFAFPPKLMLKDLSILQDLGCNIVRGSHYPQSQFWVDLLDEHGMLLWSEIPMWGCFMSLETLASPLFAERGIQMLDEMITRDYHHPSIIFWGAHNEIDTRSTEALELTKKFVGKIRSMDASRLVTYATMHPEEDIVLSYFDVIGINKYYGWYQGHVSGFRDMLQNYYANAEAQGAAGKPLIMSEFGAAGIFGDAGWEPRLFSEDYQADVLQQALAIFREDPRIVGTLIWHFADIRVDVRSDRPYFRDRARSFNNKGLLNEYRKPKLAYRLVKEIYRSER
ncbi:glycoside hydrolase family 2 protein [Paenibacillus sp. GCM10023248]|uniref:glycoside hydrolase family 2 protein n=1 Tax=Bacillales TaxID=1385 RepID=UPI00237828B9|nr:MULTISPECIES: glycoside hydrolase family 2 TIM barrel-domain containing protein [Bacillales]MDD9271368.1 glycoside hydrolase family 2 TIM barrel-domain containing protein [Paenibacillus sp. MAHUQ-63]MDR6881510.1 beta-glucuronidase [Bacillus sp. 3255]